MHFVHLGGSLANCESKIIDGRPQNLDLAPESQINNHAVSIRDNALRRLTAALYTPGGTPLASMIQVAGSSH